MFVLYIILNRSINLKIDEILFEFMAKETRLKSAKIKGILTHTTLLVNKNMPCNLSQVECFICHENGHLTNQCKK